MSFDKYGKGGGVGKEYIVTNGEIIKDGNVVGRYYFDIDSNSFWMEDRQGDGEKAFETKSDMIKYVQQFPNERKVEYNDYEDYGKGGGINKKYKYFAIGKNDNKIVNAWELISDVESLKYYAKIDLKDNDYNPKDFKIVSGKFLISQGINPYDNANWR